MANTNRTDIHEYFLQLVRLGVGTEAVSNSNFQVPESFDWGALKALADAQGLSAIVLDGLNEVRSKRPDVRSDWFPTQPFTLQWIGEVMQNYEARYAAYEKAIGGSAGFYASHDIKMMVLKGYGLSLYYPNPKHRPCGDIDTWNFGKQKEADEWLTKECGIPVDTSEHHHTVFWWKEFMVENHYDFLIESATKTNTMLEPIFKELGMDDSRSVPVNGVKVYLPSPNLNALFLLRHSLMEFVGTGISIRLLLDWAFFWKAEHKNVDIPWLLSVVEEHGMMDFFCIINKICVENLGFDKHIFPVTESKKVFLKEKVLNECLSPEYDRRMAHQRGLIKRVLFKFRRWKAGTWKRKLCYKEGQLESFLWSVRMHLLKPSSI